MQTAASSEPTSADLGLDAAASLAVPAAAPFDFAPAAAGDGRSGVWSWLVADEASAATEADAETTRAAAPVIAAAATADVDMTIVSAGPDDAADEFVALQPPHSVYDPTFGPPPHEEPAEFVTGGTRWTDNGSSSGAVTTTLGGSGGVVAWSLAGAGLTNDTGQTFFTGSTVDMGSFLPYDYAAVLRQAFDAWAAYGNIEFIQVTDGGGNIGVGTNPTIRVVGGFIDGQAGANVLARAFFPASAAAGGDMVFDNGNTTFFSNANNFFLTALHEIGHALGLDHESTSNAIAIMNPSINTSLTGLQPDDINGIRAVYGAQDFGANTYYMPTSQVNLTLIDAAPNMVVVGNGSGNTITGTDADETFRGALGDDTLNGGNGIDSAIFSGLRASYTITDLGGGSVRVVGADGTDTLNGVERLLFNDQIAFAPGFVDTARSDFNGDAGGDLLWRNVNTGQLTTWQMSGASAQPNTYVAQVGTDWQVQGTGDFNGDKRADLLWRNTSTGQFTTWQVNGTTAAQNVQSGGIGTDWRIDAIGDFNADNRDDLLWRNNDGTISTWQMSGATAQQNVFVGLVGNDWRIVGSGDFNGDGRDDLIWRNTNTGQFTTWQMNGATPQQNVLTGQVGLDWHIVGVGDFNADGRDDLVWRNNNGQVTTWQMNANGTSATQNVFSSAVATDWGIVDVSDFNGDGRDDLLWRNVNSGQVTTWQMNGGTATQNVFSAVVGTDWRVQPDPYDFV